MPINRIDGPNSVPLAVGDYQAQNNQILALGRMGDVIPFSGSTMTEGYVFQVGGTLYEVVGSVSITGTASPYVKITPSGATASAAFVASLSGVTWNAVYNGYYDGSGNRYLFDEVAAKKAGAIATIRSGWYASNADQLDGLDSSAFSPATTTSSDAALTDYPIGTILFVYGTAGIARNASQTIYLYNVGAPSNISGFQAGVGTTALTGTWRQRGVLYDSTSGTSRYLFQRVS